MFDQLRRELRDVQGELRQVISDREASLALPPKISVLCLSKSPLERWVMEMFRKTSAVESKVSEKLMCCLTILEQSCHISLRPGSIVRASAPRSGWNPAKGGAICITIAIQRSQTGLNNT